MGVIFVTMGVTAGKPAITIVSGPSGSGKTRLCAEFLRSELGDGSKYLILQGKCQLFDRDMPFAADYLLPGVIDRQLQLEMESRSYPHRCESAVRE